MNRLKYDCIQTTFLMLMFCVYSTNLIRYYVKFTDVKCQSLSDWLVVIKCEVVNRSPYDAVLYAEALIQPIITNEPQHRVLVKIKGYKLRGSKWMQYAIDYQISFCVFMDYINKKEGIPLIHLVGPMLKKRLNFIHSCPFGPNETIIANNMTFSDIPWSVPLLFPIAKYRVDLIFSLMETNKYLGKFVWYFEHGSDHTLNKTVKKTN